MCYAACRMRLQIAVLDVYTLRGCGVSIELQTARTVGHSARGGRCLHGAVALCAASEVVSVAHAVSRAVIA
jgi:hypothetical protein